MLSLNISECHTRFTIILFLLHSCPILQPRPHPESWTLPNFSLSPSLSTPPCLLVRHPLSGPVCRLLFLDHTPTAGLSSGAPVVSHAGLMLAGSCLWIPGLVWPSWLPLAPIWVVFGSFAGCLGPVLWLLLVLCFIWTCLDWCALYLLTLLSQVFQQQKYI